MKKGDCFKHYRDPSRMIQIVKIDRSKTFSYKCILIGVLPIIGTTYLTHSIISSQYIQLTDIERLLYT
jgi:hypothetical protein